MGGEIVGETAGRKRGRGRDRAVARQGDGERPGQAERSTPTPAAEPSGSPSAAGGADPALESRVDRASLDVDSSGRPTIRSAGAAFGRRLDPVWIDRLIPVLLFAAALALYLPRLTAPPQYSFDEYLHAFTASEYLKGNGAAFLWNTPCSVGASFRAQACVLYDPASMTHTPRSDVAQFEWTHPPLGRYLIAVGIALFGDRAFGWRIGGAVFGAAGIVLAYRLGLVLTRRRGVGILAACLLLADGLYFVYSRRGIIDIYGTVFMMAALLAFARYLAAPPERAGRPLTLTGVFIGLGVATKWNAAYAAAFIGAVVVWRVVRLARTSRRGGAGPSARAGLRAHLIWAPVGLVLIPLAVYAAAYIPFLLEGHGVSELFELQRRMLELHLGANIGGSGPLHPYASSWWKWPLALRPVWHGPRAVVDGNVAQTYANGNPILYWAFLPALLWVGLRWWRARDPAQIVLSIGFFGQWLPWVFADRMTFIYHFLPAVPFGCVAVATALGDLHRDGPGWRRTLAVEYVVLVAVAFAFFYPIYAFVPLDRHGVEIRMWFQSWR